MSNLINRGQTMCECIRDKNSLCDWGGAVDLRAFPPYNSLTCSFGSCCGKTNRTVKNFLFQRWGRPQKNFSPIVLRNLKKVTL